MLDRNVKINASCRRGFLSMGSIGVGSLMTGLVKPSFAATEKPTDLIRCTVVQLADLIRRREVSSLEVVNACLTRIEYVNPKLNAVVMLIANDARAQARVADQMMANNDAVGPLHGVPMTIKDSLDTAGVVTTAGTLGRKNFIPKEDATVVKRLKAAGAILLGKTNTPELTCAWETNNSVYGVTNNPWNPNLSCGGSSGGAGAIVAAGGVPFDIGSDTGGSIRLPSYFCGITGIKPTSGRVPRTGHIIGAEGHLQALTTLGPLARSVEDLSLILAVIAGPDWRDASVVPMPLGDPAQVKVKGLRVAMHTDNGAYALHPDVAKVVKDTAKALESCGVLIESKRPVALDDVIKIDADLYRADGSASLQRILDQSGTKEPSPLMLIALDQKAMTSGDMAAAIERWDAWRGRMLQFLENYDAILCPPCAFAELPHGASSVGDANSAFSYTYAYNMTGWPAAVVRAGTSSTGQPIGVQIVGKPWREDVVLALARQVEQSLGGAHQPPPI
jgi:amidase